MNIWRVWQLHNVHKLSKLSIVHQRLCCTSETLQKNKTALPLWRDTPLDQSVPGCLRSSTSQSHAQWRISQHLRGDIKKKLLPSLAKRLVWDCDWFGLKSLGPFPTGSKKTQIFFSMALQGLEAFSTSNRFDKFHPNSSGAQTIEVHIGEVISRRQKGLSLDREDFKWIPSSRQPSRPSHRSGPLPECKAGLTCQNLSVLEKGRPQTWKCHKLLFYNAYSSFWGRIEFHRPSSS